MLNTPEPPGSSPGGQRGSSEGLGSCSVCTGFSSSTPGMLRAKSGQHHKAPQEQLAGEISAEAGSCQLHTHAPHQT